MSSTDLNFVYFDKSLLSKDDPELRKWQNDALQLQDIHVKNNGLTKWFTYKLGEYDLLELRILIAVFGFRPPDVPFIIIILLNFGKIIFC
jgi:hypothetical protein